MVRPSTVGRTPDSVSCQQKCLTSFCQQVSRIIRGASINTQADPDAGRHEVIDGRNAGTQTFCPSGTGPISSIDTQHFALGYFRPTPPGLALPALSAAQRATRPLRRSALRTVAPIWLRCRSRDFLKPSRSSLPFVSASALPIVCCTARS